MIDTGWGVLYQKVILVAGGRNDLRRFAIRDPALGAGKGAHTRQHVALVDFCPEPDPVQFDLIWCSVQREL
jgi:hypothetical protein